MKYYLFGSNNEIAQTLLKNTSTDHEYIIVDRNSDLYLNIKNISKHEEKFGVIYLSSILSSEKIYNRTLAEINEQFRINAIIPIQLMEYLNDTCLNGFDFIYLSSESSIKSSYDSAYAVSKRAVEFFVKELRMKHQDSRVLCVAPSTISDGGMTVRRSDTERLEEYKFHHPKKRFLESKEVSAIIEILLKDEFAYLSNTTIEINGGKFARKII